MARVAKQLGVAELGKIIKPGRHACGRKLYMELTSVGGRNWLVRYATPAGKPTWQSLGRVDTTRWSASLQEARQRAQEALDALARGEDPQALKRAPAASSATGARVTFGQCVEEYIEKHSKRWTNEVHAQQWRDTVQQYAASIMHRPVADITVAEVRRCLEPHWARTLVTAQRTRQRIETVFDYAIGEEWRVLANPATNGVHKHALVAVPNEPEHHPALSWKELPALVSKLEKIEGRVSLALRFAIFTGGRTKEARDARWSEIDLDAKLWTLPKGRMKKRRVHKVPLSAAALKILEQCPREEGQPLVFGQLRKTSLYDLLTRNCGLKGQASVHGMRSAFADWCADNRICSTEVADAALAHVVRNRTTRAYKRTDYFDERVHVMDAWAFYLQVNAPAAPYDFS